MHNAKVQANVVFLADNQRTLIHSEPIVEQAAIFHKLPAASAHRGPAMENFSLDVVRHIVDRKGGDTDLIIHVGDMLNNSCTSEFEDVMAVLRAKKGRPVYVAPGNHDGFYLGITSPIEIQSKGWSIGLLNEQGGWAQNCTPTDDKKNCDDNWAGCLAFDRKENLAAWTKAGWSKSSDPESWPCEESDPPLCVERANPSCRDGETPGCKNFIDWSGYAANILDKYSYVLAYVRDLGLDDYCRAPEGQGAGGACPKRMISTDDRLQVRCANPGAEADRPRLRHLREICWTELRDGTGPEGFDWQVYEGEAIPLRNEYRCQIGGKPCRYREREPWRHFVVQHVVLPQGAKDAPVHFLIMDTASYEPGTVFNAAGSLRNPFGIGAANTAQIRTLQREILTAWKDDIKEDDENAQIVLVGHHPVRDFDDESKDFLGQLARVPGVTHYISGDTHDGHDVRHADLSDLREANLGATIDAPIEYALGGPLDDESGRFELARYSMTPGKVRRHGKEMLERSYAKFDGTHEACETKGFAFDKVLPAFAPRETRSMETIFKASLERP
ncbi:MAG: metallophosphoesterase [Alphaproteobacteria bacterium]|nr:metallophosphoesterase [Alphaproteobacteria bacterium]